MLITFKSPASGDVIMFEGNGKELLGLMGKDPQEPKGIVTVEQLPHAITALRAAVAADKERPRDRPDTDEKDDDRKPSDRVSLSQRALPLLELLERSLADEVPVTWGV